MGFPVLCPKASLTPQSSFPVASAPAARPNPCTSEAVGARVLPRVLPRFPAPDMKLLQKFHGLVDMYGTYGNLLPAFVRLHLIHVFA